MKNLFIASLAILATIASATPTSCTSKNDAALGLRDLKTCPGVCTAKCVDHLTFRVSLSRFETMRKRKTPKCCNWESDGCTSSPDKPLDFNFAPACYRHDFAYRNMKAQGRFTRKMKNNVDARFRKDMLDYCMRELKGIKKILFPKCITFATVYHGAVMIFGRQNLDGLNGTAIGRREAIGFELDPDIPGQVIPDVVDVDEDVENVNVEGVGHEGK